MNTHQKFLIFRSLIKKDIYNITLYIDVTKSKYENIAKPTMPAAALSDKEYDLNANTGHLDDSERTVTALGDVDDSEKEKTNTGRKSREVIFDCHI